MALPLISLELHPAIDLVPVAVQRNFRAAAPSLMHALHHH